MTLFEEDLPGIVQIVLYYSGLCMQPSIQMLFFAPIKANQSDCNYQSRSLCRALCYTEHSSSDYFTTDFLKCTGTQMHQMLDGCLPSVVR